MHRFFINLVLLVVFSASAAMAQPVPAAVQSLTNCMSEILKNSPCKNDEITFDSDDQFEAFANTLKNNRENIQFKILTYDQRGIYGEQLLPFSIPGRGNKDGLFFSSTIIGRELPIRIKDIQQRSFDEFLNSINISTTEFELPK